MLLLLHHRSARLIADEPELIVRAHRDFLDAGADVLSSHLEVTRSC